MQLAAGEAALSAARQANSPIEAWEAAALIVRWGWGAGCIRRLGQANQEHRVPSCPVLGNLHTLNLNSTTTSKLTAIHHLLATNQPNTYPLSPQRPTRQSQSLPQPTTLLPITLLPSTPPPREHSALLPQQYQASLLEALAQAASRFPQRALMRKGPGPGPLVQLRRVVPPPPALAPLRLAGPLGGTSMRRGEGAGGLGGSSSSGGQGLFIFNPYAQKRQEGAAAAAAESAVVEWVSGVRA